MTLEKLALSEKLAVLIMLIGGVESDGGGIGITPSGHAVKIPPREPILASLSPVIRDFLITAAINDLGSLISNDELRTSAQKLSTDLVKAHAQQIAEKGLGN